MLQKLSLSKLMSGTNQNKPPNINSQKWTSDTVQKIISLTDKEGGQYITKNSLEQILVRIDKSHIQVIDKFSKYRQNGFNLLEFVRFFLNIMTHQEIQNLYLTIGLIDLFKSISTFAGQQKVTFSHITNFLCQKILEKQESKNQIESKNIPEITFVKPNYQIKDFIKNPPTIYGLTEDNLFKLSPNTILTDKSKHNRAVSSSAFSHDLKMVFTHDALSQYISVYDFNCTQINKIYPSFSKIKKDVVILAFAFSQRQSRIGAVLKNFSLIFWDCNRLNNFDYQKSWQTTSYCQHLQSQIYYLEYFNAWITSDKTGMIYFWDLLNDCPNRQFKCKYFSSITTLCEISALNIIAIVQESKQLSSQTVDSSYLMNFTVSNGDKKNNFYECNITLYNFFTGEIMNEIVLSDDRVPHTIQYSQQYQILFSSGLQKKIKLWQINPVYMDSSLKGELIGHQNLIISFTLLRKTSLLGSCDDKGKIKLWDFKNFACIQTIDFSNKSIITNLLDMIEIGKIGVLGSRIHYIQFQQKQQVIKKVKNKQKLTINWVQFDECRNQIYIFTQKDLRILDMGKGCVKYIYGCFNSTDSDFSCFKYFACIFKFAIGNDKGEIALYEIGTGAFSYKLNCSHDGSVIGVQYDQLNKLVITYGSDSTIIIHRENTRQAIRELKGNFYGKQICCFELSVFHNLIAISTHQNEFSRSIFLWNYQYGKLSGQIVVNKGQDVTGLLFINGFNILVIASYQGKLNLVRIRQLSGSQIRMQEMGYIQLKRGVTCLNCDIVLKGGKKSQLQQCVLIVSFQDGDFQEVNITSQLQKFQLVGHIKQKNNYNPYRESKQSFSAEYTKKKHFVLQLESYQNLKRKQEKQPSCIPNLGSTTTGLFNKKSSNIIQTQIDIQLDQIQMEDEISYEQNPNKNQLPLIKLISTIKNNQPPQIQSQKVQVTHIHPNSSPTSSGLQDLNILKLMNYQKRFLLMIGNNNRLKIFSQDHKLICDLNINYPLPYMWMFKPKVHKKIQDKIYFAIKVLNSILQKYQTDISVGQAKNYKLKLLFDVLNSNQVRFMSQSHQSNNQTLMLTEPDLNQSLFKFQKRPHDQKIPLIQQEYTKKDINFSLVKQYNQHQVAGPTLKQLDHIKKIQLLQKQWKQKQKQQHNDRDRLLKMIQSKVKKNQEKQQISGFLSPSHKIKDSKETPYILNLRKKIDNARNLVEKDQQVKERDRSMPYLNTNKTINFSSHMNKTGHKKLINEKTLKDTYFSKMSASVKSINRLNQTSFEDYYNSVRDGNSSYEIFNRLNKTKQGSFSPKFNDTCKNWEQILGINNRNSKIETAQNGQNRSTKKQFSSLNKFRRILTEMNDKVRQKKIEKIKL